MVKVCPEAWIPSSLQEEDAEFLTIGTLRPSNSQSWGLKIATFKSLQKLPGAQPFFSGAGKQLTVDTM